MAPRAPTTAEIERRSQEILERHRAEVSVLESTRRLVPNPEPAPRRAGLLSRVLGARPRASEDLKARNAQARERVRALGHHLEALERDLVMLDAEVEALGREVAAAAAGAEEVARDRVSQEEALARALLGQEGLTGSLRRDQEAEAAALEARLAQNKREEARFRAAEARYADLFELQRETRRSLSRVEASLQELYTTSLRSLGELDRQLASLTAAAVSRELAEEAASSLDALRASLERVSLLADERAHDLEGRLEALESRIRSKDDDAAARRRAVEEVEAALGDLDPDRR